jgi:hypothetical protein
MKLTASARRAQLMNLVALTAMLSACHSDTTCVATGASGEPTPPELFVGVVLISS